MNPQSDCGTPTKKQTIALRQAQRRASRLNSTVLAKLWMDGVDGSKAVST